MTDQPIHDVSVLAVEAEAAVVGACLMDRDAIADVVERLSASAFAHPRYRALYEGVCDCFATGTPPDPVTVKTRMVATGTWSATEDTGFVAAAMLACPYGVHAGYYADSVIAFARGRAIEAAAGKLATGAYAASFDPLVAMQGLETTLESFGSIAAAGPRSYAEMMPAFRQRLVQVWDGTAEREETTTGYRSLDALLGGGFRPGELVVLGARPGMGKTAFALQLAHNAARAQRSRRTVIFSSEMSADALLFRAVSEVSRLSARAIVSGEIDTAQRNAVLGNTEFLETLPVSIDDTSAIVTGAMQARVGRAKAKGRVGLVIFDYLELAGDRDRGESEERRVGEIVRRLKHLAMTEHVPVLVLSQLNRSVESRRATAYRPVLADLRYSGAIEQVADAVCFLYRYDYYANRDMVDRDASREGQAEVLVAKQRNGPAGEIVLAFDDTTMSFEEYEQ